ncbi:MAG: restriction endonuclease subunit S [Methylobacter sp.]|jgi:type I restriction enzyme S subunit|uniref:restriction endonuclease subunit S n=1 Tax=Methylobacter sp. TaxID=2051955 RepID=UPI0025E241A5|nr:restriction endonuclease subunit S [Methylobacter sp.]MCK9622624.1 restriction endonuclease subunit S [Methylobacter sp.]
MSWRSCRLGDVMTLKRGHDLPAQSRQDGDVPVVSSSGITGYHKEAKATAPGVVTGRYGTLGEVFYLTQDYWPLNTSLYVIDFKGNDPQFSAYFLKNVLKDYQSDKAAVPGVDRNVLHEIKVQAPDYPTQLRITEVLSSYDDLIENNRRRMALLEESARLLYCEWFVRLRFPGYEHTHIVDGVPDGWERKTLSELCEEIRELVSPSSLEPDTPYIGLEHMPRRSIALNEWDTVEKVTSSKSRFKAGEILFGKIRPYFHKVGVAFVDGVASSDTIVMRPIDEKLHGLVMMTVSSDEFVAVTAQQMKEGSKMPRADWKQMQAYPVPLPPEGLLSAFDDVIQPIIAQLKSLTFANQKLRAARDLLLPRLMSGEIAV